METLVNSICNKAGHGFRILFVATILYGQTTNIQGTPLEWMYYFEDNNPGIYTKSGIRPEPDQQDFGSFLTLSCKPEVNVSLGLGGYAVLTSIMLVNAPDYPPFQYDVDIMGPLNDTVFCEQIGQELMVIVTELPTGNSCMSTVFVEDKLKPVLTCSPDTLPCNVDIPSIDFEELLDVVTDNCDDDPDLFYSYTVQNLPCNPNGFTQQILVIWTATDDSGNSATCQDIIYLQKPAIGQIVFPPDVSVDCLNPNIDPSATGEPTYNGEPLGFACQYVVFYSDQVVPMCNGAQKIIRLWTVMDWCNSAQVTDVQEILIIDNVPPDLTCPASLTIGTNPGVCTTKYTLPIPVVNDACASEEMIDIDIFVSSVPGIFSPGQMVNLGLGSTLITIRATDPCGNSSLCSYTVTVKDFIPPIPICNSLTIGLGPDGMATLFADLLNFPVIENCGILSKQIWKMTNTCGVPEDLNPGPDVKFCCADAGDTLMVGFKVTDLSGNMNTCMFQVIVKDQIPPVIDCEDITVSITNQGTIVVSPSDVVNFADDNCFVVDTIVTPGTFDCDDVGENVVIVTVTDQSGNTATCTATVTIVDDVPPVALCQDITVTLNGSGTAVITAQQVNNGSSDNCAIDTMYLNQYEFDCDDEGTNVVQLTVEDLAGNTATCTATVTILTNPPVAICQNITVSLIGSTVTITGEQINNNSTDDCGIVDYDVTPATFDCTDLGPNTVTLTVTDSSGNTSTCTAIVTVEDVTLPLAVCQDITVSLNAQGIAVITGAQINNGSSDNCGMITLTANPDTLTCEDIGPNTVTLTVTDQSGNTSTCTANVTVTNNPPTAICQDITVSLGANGMVIIQGVDVDGGSGSNCGDVTFTLDENTFDCTELGDNIVILTVTDTSGATSTCTATVTVTDDLGPICSSQDITVFVDAMGTVSILPGQINDGSTDNCSIVGITVTPVDFTCDDLGPNTVTLTVTDQSANSSTCTATVTVVDTISPICNTQNITVSVGGGTMTILPSQVNNGSSDNCDTVMLDVEPDMFDCDDLGPNIVVLTVTDGSGNSSTCTATVTVEDSGGLVANCQNVTIFLDTNGNASVTPGQVDNGSGGGCTPGGLVFDLSQTMFNCANLGPNVVVLTVTDSENNTATCTAIITVTDNTPPMITCPVNVTVECSTVTNPNNTGQFGSATASDNCPGVTIQENAIFNLNDCNVGTITRIFTATDSSLNTASCVQIVTFINSNPFTESDITWPATPISVNICNSTDPEDIPNGQPVFDPGSLQCANPVATFSDQVQMNIDNNPNTPCQIITRTWTVTDTCQQNGTFVFVQTINVVDMVPPLFTNINDMTNVATASCTAFFTLIASASDCAGVTITNNSPFGVNTGANASGDYPIGQTVVLFTATDGCGNISTMDVVITVTDPDPTGFQCNKVIVILPPELEIIINAEIFVTFFPGNCSDQDDFIISYSDTDPFDTTNIYDCSDVGVTTFPLWFWNATGTVIVDSCEFADLDLRDPDDLCMDGTLLVGNVENEDGLAVNGVDVHVTNAPMEPGTTNANGHYQIEGLSEGTGYEIAPFKDIKHREGVSTLDLVHIQKHLLGRTKLNSPYKMIAADANKSGHLTALDLLEIRKLILGITTRFTNNTSWRFVDKDYSFPDPYNPFYETFAEYIWIDSVTPFMSELDFVGIKIGDVNGSYFHTVQSGKIEPRSDEKFYLQLNKVRTPDEHGWVRIKAGAYNGSIDGLQFSLHTGGLTDEQIQMITSEFLDSEHWFYDRKTGLINVSWTTEESQDIGGKMLLEWPALNINTRQPDFQQEILKPEAYKLSGEFAEVREVVMAGIESSEEGGSEYHLYQNKPNPFEDGTVISFVLPQDEDVRLVIHDITGRQVFEYKDMSSAGRNEVHIRAKDLKTPGIYYYTLYTGNVSFTRKMSFTNN